MRFIVTTFLVLGLLCLVLSGTAAASPKAKKVRSPAASPSRDKNCAAKRGVVKKCLSHYFDRNHDQRISRKEYTDAQEEFLAPFQSKKVIDVDRFISECDSNLDGRVTMKEFDITQKRCFSQCHEQENFIKYFCVPAQTKARELEQQRQDLFKSIHKQKKH